MTLYAPNSWEWIVSYYGALKTGAVIDPVNVMLTPAEVAYVTRDCGAKALIGSPDKVAPALEAASKASRPSCSAIGRDRERRRATNSSRGGRLLSRLRSAPTRSRPSAIPPAPPAIRAELAAYRAPRAIQFVADLPKTWTGKIMRRELKKLDARRYSVGARFTGIGPLAILGADL